MNQNPQDPVIEYPQPQLRSQHTIGSSESYDGNFYC